MKRSQKKELLAEREPRLEEIEAGTDVAVLRRELERLREEVQRLQDLLLEHGIEPGVEPGESGQQTAWTAGCVRLDDSDSFDLGARNVGVPRYGRT